MTSIFAVIVVIYLFAKFYTRFKKMGKMDGAEDVDTDIFDTFGESVIFEQPTQPQPQPHAKAKAKAAVAQPRPKRVERVVEPKPQEPIIEKSSDAKHRLNREELKKVVIYSELLKTKF